MEKYTLSVNDKHKFELTEKDIAQADIINKNEDSFHILKDGKGYPAKVLNFDMNSGFAEIQVNDNVYKVKISDKFDRLIKRMGLTTNSKKKVNEINAPMPGLVLDILVKKGAEIKKGDKLIILEAMKMENVLKSSGDGVIKKIHVKKGEPVDKGQLLISL